jgi:hypothetical protein
VSDGEKLGDIKKTADDLKKPKPYDDDTASALYQAQVFSQNDIDPNEDISADSSGDKEPIPHAVSAPIAPASTSSDSSSAPEAKTEDEDENTHLWAKKVIDDPLTVKI